MQERSRSVFWRVVVLVGILIGAGVLVLVLRLLWGPDKQATEPRAPETALSAPQRRSSVRDDTVTRSAGKSDAFGCRIEVVDGFAQDDVVHGATVHVWSAQRVAEEVLEGESGFLVPIGQGDLGTQLVIDVSAPGFSVCRVAAEIPQELSGLHTVRVVLQRLAAIDLVVTTTGEDIEGFSVTLRKRTGDVVVNRFAHEEAGIVLQDKMKGPYGLIDGLDPHVPYFLQIEAEDCVPATEFLDALSPGESRRVSVTLERASSLAVRVISHRGEPQDRFVVRARKYIARDEHTTFRYVVATGETDASGLVLLSGLSSGTVVVEAERALDGEGVVVGATVEISPGARETVTLVVAAHPRIEIQVLDPSEKPCPGILLRVREFSSGGLSVIATTDSEGRAWFKGHRPGRISVWAMNARGGTLFQDRFILPDDETEVEKVYQLTASPETRLGDIVVHCEPLFSSEMPVHIYMLHHDTGAQAAALRKSSDENWPFTFRQRAYGVYRIEARIGDRWAVEPYVVLDCEEVEILLVPRYWAREVAGRVTRENGEALPRIHVNCVRDADVSVSTSSTVTDAEGRFSLRIPVIPNDDCFLRFYAGIAERSLCVQSVVLSLDDIVALKGEAVVLAVTEAQ